MAENYQDTNYQDIENALRAAVPDAGSRELDTAALREKAHRRIAARDIVGFSFAHLLRTLLTLFSGVYRQVDARSRPPHTDRNTENLNNKNTNETKGNH